MATNTQNAKHNWISGALQTAEHGTRPVQEFLTKFNKDWAMNLSAALAYNLMMAVFPLVIALFSILGLILGALNPAAYDQLRMQIMHVFPSATSASSLLDAALNQLKKNAGFLGILAIVLALFNGSRLFILIEGCFDIIYHIKPRSIIPQNAMAFAMLLLFIILVPIMIFAATGPALVFSILQHTPIGQIPGIKLVFSLGGILGGLIAAYILFQAIYIVVPNQKISFRNSWLGSVVAAILLQAYLILFPLYVARFLTGYASQALGLVILLIFFYYFAVILFLGAEVNAFKEGVRATPSDLVTLVHDVTSHLPTSEKGVQQQAAPSHKDVPPKDIVPKDQQTDKPVAQAHDAQTPADMAVSSQEQPQKKSLMSRLASILPTRKPATPEMKPSPQKSTSKAWTTVEVVAGTLLTFLVEWVRLRHKKAVQ
jgi:membrane protein